MDWRNKLSKETAKNIGILVEIQGHLERLCSSQTEKSCNSSSKDFSCVFSNARAHPLLAGEHYLWESPGWQNFPTKILHIFAIGRTNSRWKHCFATKIFLAAGRQVAERLTLQHSPTILVFLRRFKLSGAIWGKGWKNSISWVFWVGAMYLRDWRVFIQLCYRNPCKIFIWM